MARKNRGDIRRVRIEDAAGLTVTHPENGDASETDEEEEEAEIDVNDAEIDARLAEDAETKDVLAETPHATIAQTLAEIGAFYNKGEALSRQLSVHLRNTGGEPELHSYLLRIQTQIGEFRHAMDHLDNSVSDDLRQAVEQAMLV